MLTLEEDQDYNNNNSCIKYVLERTTLINWFAQLNFLSANIFPGGLLWKDSG